VVGVWNCESSDRIKGCDGAGIHAIGSLAGANGWSLTKVAAFSIFQGKDLPVPFSILLGRRPANADCSLLCFQIQEEIQSSRPVRLVR
jgi:hypothetical protein